MPVLGELESAVMEVLWSRRVPLSVREVHDVLIRRRDLAYTTVMTVLDRLSKKAIANRELEGRAWLYSPAMSRPELFAAEITDLLDALPAAEREDVLRRISASAPDR